MCCDDLAVWLSQFFPWCPYCGEPLVLEGDGFDGFDHLRVRTNPARFSLSRSVKPRVTSSRSLRVNPGSPNLKSKIRLPRVRF